MHSVLTHHAPAGFWSYKSSQNLIKPTKITYTQILKAFFFVLLFIFYTEIFDVIETVFAREFWTSDCWIRP